MASVLILTQYYPPETGAPQNRLSSLAMHLSDLGMDVTVLTAMPNYPSMQIHNSYSGRWYCKEMIDNIPVHRSWIFVKKSNSILFRLLNYFSFVLTSLYVGIFKIKRHDYVICESPPLFLGISALGIKFFKKSKLIFNVSDLWPESAEKLNIVRSRLLLKTAYALEARLYKKSKLVTGQTQGIIANINMRYPKIVTYWLPNGIDIKKNIQPDTNWRFVNGFSDTDFIVLYAGVLGHAQGLDVVLRAAFRIHDKSIKFVFAGDGPQKDYLLSLKEQLKLDTVFFIGNQPTKNMPAIISAIDAAVVPLKKLPLFEGAIPSKIFENLYSGKPILLGVDGEARQLFIEEGQCGLYYTPENEDELAEAILLLKNDQELQQRLGNNGMKFVRDKFDRRKIAEAFYKRMLEV